MLIRSNRKPIETLLEIERETSMTLDGQTSSVKSIVGTVIETVRKSDGKELIILQIESGSYVWNANNDDWNSEISINPEDESRWVVQGDYNG